MDKKIVIGFTVSIAFGDWGNADKEGIVTGGIIAGKVYYKNETAQGDLLLGTIRSNEYKWFWNGSVYAQEVQEEPALQAHALLLSLP